MIHMHKPQHFISSVIQDQNIAYILSSAFDFNTLFYPFTLSENVRSYLFLKINYFNEYFFFSLDKWNIIYVFLEIQGIWNIV